MCIVEMRMPAYLKRQVEVDRDGATPHGIPVQPKV